MPQHPFARSAAAVAAHSPRDRWLHHHRNEVTEIIALDDFGDLDDLDFLDDPDFGPDFGADRIFDHEARLLSAPELDDLDDADDLTPQPLATPDNVQARAVGEPDPRSPRCSGAPGSTAGSQPAPPRGDC